MERTHKICCKEMQCIAGTSLSSRCAYYVDFVQRICLVGFGVAWLASHFGFNAIKSHGYG
jgi:hypothetical protein